MNRIQLTLISTAAAMVIGFSSGCAWTKACCDKKSAAYNDPFFRKDEQRLIERVGRQQAASAARADASLTVAHFHGDKLNSLGEQKLGLVLEDDDTSKPLVVYMDMAEDTLSAGRRSSVEAFLIANGMNAEQFKLENGVNPNGLGTPAAPLLKNLVKTDIVGGGGMSQ